MGVLERSVAANKCDTIAESLFRANATKTKGRDNSAIYYIGTAQSELEYPYSEGDIIYHNKYYLGRRKKEKTWLPLK